MTHQTLSLGKYWKLFSTTLKIADRYNGLQIACYKVSDRIQAFVLHSYTMHELRTQNQNVCIGLFFRVFPSQK